MELTCGQIWKQNPAVSFSSWGRCPEGRGYLRYKWPVVPGLDPFFIAPWSALPEVLSHWASSHRKPLSSSAASSPFPAAAALWSSLVSNLRVSFFFFCSHDWGPESWLQPHFSWLGPAFTEHHLLTCKLGPTMTICCKGQRGFSEQLLHGGTSNRVSEHQLTWLLFASWWCLPLLHTPASWVCTALGSQLFH